jgi:hypothetical protein
MRPPALASWLLDRFGVNDSIIGDMVESYEHGRSRGWLCRQVTVALFVTLVRHAREHRGLAGRWLAIGVTSGLLISLPPASLGIVLGAWVLIYSFCGLAVVLLSVTRNR